MPDGNPGLTLSPQLVTTVEGYIENRCTLQEPFPEFVRDSFLAAAENMGAASELRAAHDFQHEVVSGDTLHLAEPCQCPIHTAGIPSGMVGVDCA